MKMLGSRRFILALVALVGLIYLGSEGQQTGLHIATLVVGVAATNAYQKKEK